MEKKVKLLLAEDDENLGLLLKEYLVAKGYDTDLYPDGEAAYKGFTKNQPYSLCILDIMMPKKDGISLAKDIRLLNMDIPIIFLTAKNMKEDVLEGFKIGADDYITKPFDTEVLIFKLKAILKRQSGIQPKESDFYQIGSYLFDYKLRTIEHEGLKQKLSPKETELLKMLCENQNELLHRETALKKIWGDDGYFTARSMDVYLTKLRKLFAEDPSVEIRNIHGSGFMLEIKDSVN